jgi:hypothetical protein
VILRKGGIAEDRDGFTFKHSEFFLFPTFFHGQIGRTRAKAEKLPTPRSGEIAIELFARVERWAVITSWDVAAALERFHVLDTEVVRERFAYDAAGSIHVAFVRVFRLTPVWSFPDERRYGGCRSWLELPALPAGVVMKPVLAESEHVARLEQFRAIADVAATAQLSS